MWSSVIFNTIGDVLHFLKIKLPTAYSTEAEASDTSVASILHHDLLNCEEPVTVWSPSPKCSQLASYSFVRNMRTDCIIVTTHQGHSQGTDHNLRIELPAAYSSEAEASDTSVASILHHDLLNCEEPVTLWSPSTKSTLS